MACDVCCLSHEGFAHVCEPDIPAGETCHKIKTFTCDSCSIQHRTIGGALKSEVILSAEPTNLAEIIDCDDPTETRVPGLYVPDIRPQERDVDCNAIRVTYDSETGVPLLFSERPRAGRQNSISIIATPPNPAYQDPTGASNRVRHVNVPLADRSFSLPDADAYFDASRYNRPPGEQVTFTTDVARWEIANDEDCPNVGEYDMILYHLHFFEAPTVLVRRGVAVLCNAQLQIDGNGWIDVETFEFSNWTNRIEAEVSHTIDTRPFVTLLQPGETRQVDARQTYIIKSVEDGVAGAAWASPTPDFVNSGSGIDYHALILNTGNMKSRAMWAGDYS